MGKSSVTPSAHFELQDTQKKGKKVAEMKKINVYNFNKILGTENIYF